MLNNRNAFKLGLFGCNCESGLAITKAPERWQASWDNNVSAARMAEDAGLEFMLPIARWHGYRGESNAQGSSFETLSWAAGLLSATTRITVFATIHLPFLNPVFAAKQAVTIQAIGRGRFGLNVVAGGNAPEFAMFGVELLEHDDRYRFAEEWLTIVKRIWSEAKSFDFNGRFFNLREVSSDPKPYRGIAPLILSAGSSPAGRDFAIRNADSLFMNIPQIETLAAEIKQLRAAGRDSGVFASGHVICRRTQKEALEYRDYIVDEMGDWDAVEHILHLRQEQKSIPVEKLAKMKERLIGGIGTYPVIGDPDTVAATFKTLHDAGLDGMAVGFIDYIAELPFFRDEVLPRLARYGMRPPVSDSSQGAVA